MKVFCSLPVYAIGKLLGVTEGVLFVRSSITEVLAGRSFESLRMVPPIRLVAELAQLVGVENVTLRLDAGSADIAKVRCDHLHEFVKSGCDVWLTVDDDTDAQQGVLPAMLKVAEDSEPCIFSAPCLTRHVDKNGVMRCNVELGETSVLDGGEHAVTYRGVPVRPIVGGGFSLVSMNWQAARTVAKASPSYVSEDGVVRAAAFHPILEDDDQGRCRWYSEDQSFFRRARLAQVPAFAVLTGQTVHAGLALDLSQLLEQIRAARVQSMGLELSSEAAGAPPAAPAGPPEPGSAP